MIFRKKKKSEAEQYCGIATIYFIPLQRLAGRIPD